MSSNLIHLQHAGAAAPSGPETIEAAVREVSAHIAGHVAGHRRGYARLGELETGDPSVRRRSPRAAAVAPLRPVTFFSIEEAPEESGRLRRA
jgi:hypothetical protein